ALTVTPDTTTQISATPAATRFGQTVTLTAMVSATSGTSKPTGTVTFMDSSQILGTAPLAVDSHTGLDIATLQVSTLSAGSHALNAFYGGVSGNFSASNSLAAPASVTVQPTDTKTTLSISTTTSDFGELVTLTAKVSPVAPGAGVPSGLV